MNTWPNWIKRLFGVPVSTPDGRWVAEAWLEWEICRGSTLYRERFDRPDAAAKAARRAAGSLDFHLPKGDFGIQWGVRLACENDTERRIWSPYMPGSRNCRGEHRNSHPLQQS
jgi:hypothetical protein